MKSCIISCILSFLHLHFSRLLFPCSLESNPPCIFNNRAEVLPFAKTSLNQIRGFAKVFKPKFKGKQKRKEKENRKRLKGCGAALRPKTGTSPRPTILFPEPVLSNRDAPRVDPWLKHDLFSF
jgi:hypothetical protein